MSDRIIQWALRWGSIVPSRPNVDNIIIITIKARERLRVSLLGMTV